MNQQARDAYNSKFTAYVKDNASATDVRSLIDNTISSNNENVNQVGKFVYIDTEIVYYSGSTKPANGLGESVADGGNTDPVVSAVAANMSKLKAKINSGKRYDISAEYNAGLIYKIGIVEK